MYLVNCLLLQNSRYHGLHIGSRSSTRSTSISSSSSALMSCELYILFLVVVVIIVVVVVFVVRRSLRLFNLALPFTVNFSSSLTSDIEVRHRGLETAVVGTLMSWTSSAFLLTQGVDRIGDMFVQCITESISLEVPTVQGATTLAI